MVEDPRKLIPILDELGYIVEEELATVIYLMLKLGKPLLLEGNPGVGKTEVAYILSSYLKADLVRLQCYEGLDVHNAIYEWNYQKQLLAIKLQEKSELSVSEKEDLIFSEDYLLKRPLLQAISSDKQVVLLIDEIDRADEEFEAFLLELLSVFQISIPEIGTVQPKVKPLVLLTSNRTRELSDALRRRCLYHWIDYPSIEKELMVIKKHIPNIEDQLAHQITAYIKDIRQLKMEKIPGISETIDWANGILSLRSAHNQNAILESISCLVKSEQDTHVVKAYLESSAL